MKKSIQGMADTLYYFVPSLLIGVLGAIFLCFCLRLKSTTAEIIVAIIFGVVWLVAWLLWARLTPRRRRWDFLAPIAAAVCPLYLWWMFSIVGVVFGFFILFPLNLFLIIPAVLILIVTFFVSSAYIRKSRDEQPERECLTFWERLLPRVVAVVVGCVLLVIPPACVVAAYPQLDAEYSENVLVYYYAEHGDVVNIRKGDLGALYQLQGLSAEEFLGTNHVRLWGESVPQVIMHPDTQEPLLTFPLRSLRFTRYEQEDVSITDKQMLDAFRAFVSNENNGVAMQWSSEYDGYKEVRDDGSVQLFFDVACDMYWFADYDIQDGKVMVYGRLHKSEEVYAYDVTHIVGEYLL